MTSAHRQQLISGWQATTNIWIVRIRLLKLSSLENNSFIIVSTFFDDFASQLAISEEQPEQPNDIMRNSAQSALNMMGGGGGGGGIVNKAYRWHTERYGYIATMW